MKLVSINSSNFGSTGNIMTNISDLATQNGFEAYICVPKSRDNSVKKVKNQIFIGNRFSRNIHLKAAEITGLQGCFSILSTYFFLKKIDKVKPDIIHLHNLHNCYINLNMLFNYIKRHNISTIWTLHDCWGFTGQCPYFTLAKCDKWKTGCYKCPQYKQYPKSYIDRTKTMWKLKKKWFTGIKSMTIVTPSKWLADLVQKSFLGEYPVKVINNGIDLSVFKPIESDFCKKYNCVGKFILLGVAFSWGKRKGLDVFVELSKRLDNHYQIVLVGTDENVDNILPENIISIHHTRNQQELAEIYSAADLFVNPTREEVFGLVNIEALACGSPVITFNTGGSPECVDETCGSVVDCDDVDALEKEIIRVCTEKPFSKEACLNRAKRFDVNQRFEKYVKLYSDIV